MRGRGRGEAHLHRDANAAPPPSHGLQASFATDEGGVDLDDPQFWSKILGAPEPAAAAASADAPLLLGKRKPKRAVRWQHPNTVGGAEEDGSDAEDGDGSGDEAYEPDPVCDVLVKVIPDIENVVQAKDKYEEAMGPVGKSLLMICPKEHAEGYAEQLIRADPEMMVFAEIEEE